MVTPLDKRPRSGPYSGITIRSAKRFLTEQFKASGVVTPEDDARDLVMEVTQFSLTDFALRGTEFLTPEQFDTLKGMADRRMAGEPVDNIVGWREFYGRRFNINKDVLSPRGDTETLIIASLKAINSLEASSILDLGTGSGAILITLLAEREKARGVAIDISDAALAIATENAASLGVSGRAEFKRSEWFEAVSGQFDLIVSNPPYITNTAMDGLDTDVLGYDPDIALRGGESGLEAYRVIIRDAGAYLKPGGVLWVEIGFDQREAVTALFAENGYSNIQGVKDLSGHDRCVGGVFATL